MNSIGFRLFLVGLSLLVGFAAYGQAKWINSYGSLGQDEALCSDAVGNNYYVGGYFIVLSSRVPVDGERTQTGVVYVKR